MNAITPTCLTAALFFVIAASLSEPHMMDGSPATPIIEPMETKAPDEPVEPAPELVEPEPVEHEPVPVVEGKYREDIPLTAEVQDHIFSLCDEKGIEPEIVFAMIWRESRYKAEAMGDNGKAYGLMQIHPRWHSARMERIGVTDLLDPIQNVTVGIDYLSEQYNKYGDITHAIVSYNKGHYAGEITDYAKDVLAEAERIKESNT